MVEKYLYHYTSVNSLAMILKSRKIRFNSLANVDDITEVKMGDSETIGKYCFVSSWIDEVKESMPLWIQYGDNGKGVRIGLPPDPFKKYNVDPVTKIKLSFNQDRTLLREYSDFNMLDKCNYIPFMPEEFLSKVYYTDDKNLLFPIIKNYTIEGLIANLSLLGKCKRKEWSFQNEYRYKLLFLPVTYQEAYDGLAAQKIESEPNIGITDYFLDIDDYFFNMMDITIGPRADIATKSIVKDLLEKYNKDALFKESEMTGVIR